MRKVKWLFFAYIGLCLLVLAGIAVSFAVIRERDPATFYGTYGASIKSLDPPELGDGGSMELAGYVYECLYNYAYGEDRYRLIPELADGDPQVSADGKTLIIHIKPGVHFYDPERAVFSDGTGPEVTAADFIYSWKRICNFHSGFTTFYSQIFQGHVVGIDDWFGYTQSCPNTESIDWDRPVAGLTALDRYTLQIQLLDPFPQLQFDLAMPPTAVVCRQAVEHYGSHFKNHMVGTGPYAMAEYRPEERMVFIANPLYRGGPNVKSGTVLPADQQLPHIKRVQLHCFSEALPPWYLFLQGQLDLSLIPKDTFNQAMQTGTGQLTDAMRRDGIGLVTYHNPEVSFVAFNLSDPVVGKNKPLRQAMSMAFDRRRYIDLYLNGRGVIANGPIPPGFPTYDPKRVAPYCEFNLAAAKAKMKEAIAINGGPLPPLHVLYRATDTTTAQYADFFANQMREIGLEVRSEFKPYGPFLEMIDRHQEQIYNLGWVADYPDEQDFWQLFYGKNIGPGGLNGTGYNNPAFDALYEKTVLMADSPERSALYRQMQDMVLEDCPWITTDYPLTYQLYHNWLSTPWISMYGYGYRQYSELNFAARSTWMRNR